MSAVFKKGFTMKDKMSLPIIIFIFLLFVCSEVMGQTCLRLATVENFPPYAYKNDGVITGIAVDIVYEMARKLDIKIEIKVYPWRRVLESLEEGVVDGGFSLFKKNEREAFCLYTGVIQYEQYNLFVKKGHSFPFSGIKDLYGKRIGIDRGVFVSGEFEKAVKDGKIMLEEVNDMAMLNVKKVCNNRLDAIIGDVSVIPYYSKVSGYSGEIISLGAVHEQQASYFVLSKKSALSNKIELQKQITDVLTKMWEDGSCQNIINRYHNSACK